MKERRRIKRVVVALRMAGIAGQDKLNGIFEYLSEGRRWTLAIYRTLQEFTPEVARSEVARGADGFILGIPGADAAMAAVAAAGLPAIVMNVDPSPLLGSRGGYVLVKGDAEAVGREAAQTLLRQGVYRSYGYVGYRTDDDWSRDRGRAFRDALECAGFVGRMFDAVHYADRIEDRAALLDWLHSLPKPCGIFAACDDRAFEILEVCNEAGIRVPQEIGLLGVNNDPILCENAEPRLSSIQPDFTREGYLAAQILDRGVGSRSGETVSVGIRQIVHRESTYPLSHSGRLVQKALAWIDRNAARRISVADVARRLGVSRSLLDLRFRELQHETVHDAIVRRRLALLKSRLLTSHASIAEVSADCGWGSLNAVKNLFRRRFGTTMRDFRRQASHP